MSRKDLWEYIQNAVNNLNIKTEFGELYFYKLLCEHLICGDDTTIDCLANDDEKGLIALFRILEGIV